MTEQPTTTTFPPANNWNPPTTPPKKKRWFTSKAVWIPAGALIAGLVMGSSTQPAPEVREVEKIVTKEVPVEKIVEVEKEVKVPVTPASCLEALDLNEQAFDYASESMEHIVAGDLAAAEASTNQLSDLSPRVNAAKAECRAAE